MTGKRDPGAVAVAAAQSRLRRSIRKDRARVCKAYDLRLSESGSLLEKGDSQARSSLKRVLRRLKAALTQVLRTVIGTPDAVIDYESLVALSNSSRIDAIRAIDDLSRRISEPVLIAKGQRSRSPKSIMNRPSNKSLASSDSSGTDKTGSLRKKSKKKKRETKISGYSTLNCSHEHQAQKTDSDGVGRCPEAKESETNPMNEATCLEENSFVTLAANGSSQAPKIQLLPIPPQSALLQPQQQQPLESQRYDANNDSRLKSPSAGSKLSPTSNKRFSIASFSSDNTRLGETPWTPGLNIVIDEEHGICPVFPLRPFARPPTPPRRRSFWARFSGRS